LESTSASVLISRNFVDASLITVILEEAQRILADEEWRVGAKRNKLQGEE
jgi:hypothetical protein